MKVKLVSYTQPSQELQDLGVKDFSDIIVYCARVSNPANQANMETGEKLLKYLVAKSHWSPFEMTNICVEIETTRDIARQILRHRSFSFSELSQRYSKILTQEPTIRDARLQDTKNRQNSLENFNEQLTAEWKEFQHEVWAKSYEKYEWALSQGIAKEVARSVLPEGMTESRLYMSGTTRSWLHYLVLRTDVSTQKEHRDVALACRDEIAKIFPLINTLLA